MKKYGFRLLCIIVILGLLAWEYIPGPRKSTLDASTLGVDEVTPLALELVYEGEKPEGVSSVQGFAITDDYFVVAGRPRGSAAEGGESNNRLIIIDRQSYANVTGDFFEADETMELGHANGMTYDSVRGELVVVGMRDVNGDYRNAARINAEDFQLLETLALPCYASGIAYDDDSGCYFVRSGTVLTSISGTMNQTRDEYYIGTLFTGQDIGFYHGKAYLVNWINKDNLHDAWKVGLDLNENIVYQFDIATGRLCAFIVSEPYQEMESIDFVDGEAYVLINGTGLMQKKYFIYKALFDPHGIE